MSVASNRSCVPDLSLQYNVLESVAGRDMIVEFRTRHRPNKQMR